jgi:predicted phage tail protein
MLAKSKDIRSKYPNSGDEFYDEIDDMLSDPDYSEMRKKQIHLQNIRNMQIPEKQKQLEQQKMGLQLENNEQQQENKKQTDESIKDDFTALSY